MVCVMCEVCTVCGWCVYVWSRDDVCMCMWVVRCNVINNSHFSYTNSIAYLNFKSTDHLLHFKLKFDGTVFGVESVCVRGVCEV